MITSDGRNGLIKERSLTDAPSTASIFAGGLDAALGMGPSAAGRICDCPKPPILFDVDGVNTPWRASLR